MRDPWNDPQWKNYVTHVRTEVVPKIEGSSLGISIVPRNPEDVDVKFAVELGLMIMLDKPIIMAVHPATLLPEKLRRVADEIVITDRNGSPANEEMMAAIKRVTDRLDG